MLADNCQLPSSFEVIKSSIHYNTECMPEVYSGWYKHNFRSYIKCCLQQYKDWVKGQTDYLKQSITLVWSYLLNKYRDNVLADKEQIKNWIKDKRHITKNRFFAKPNAYETLIFRIYRYVQGLFYKIPLKIMCLPGKNSRWLEYLSKAEREQLVSNTDTSLRENKCH